MIIERDQLSRKIFTWNELKLETGNDLAHIGVKIRNKMVPTFKQLPKYSFSKQVKLSMQSNITKVLTFLINSRYDYLFSFLMLTAIFV